MQGIAVRIDALLELPRRITSFDTVSTREPTLYLVPEGMHYRFDRFELNSASRMLCRDQVQLDVSRRVFDCLDYMIEHRDRAISRDELIGAVWKRHNVSDNQLAHTIAALRRLLDDDGAAQRFIRTVPGFGYHWVADVKTSEDVDGESVMQTAVPVASDEPVLAESVVEPQAIPFLPVQVMEPAQVGRVGVSVERSPTRRRTWQMLALTTWVALALIAIVWSLLLVVRPPEKASIVASVAKDVWVLPAVVADESQAWARVGLMALVSEGLRQQGLAVVPIEKSLVRFTENLNAAEALGLLQDLDAALLVVPSVHQVGKSWVVDLAAYSRTGDPIRLNAGNADLLAAGRLAVQYLSRRLGYSGTDLNGSTDESLELIRLMIRGRDFEGALLQLSRLPDAVREQPDAGLLDAELDQERGFYRRAKDESDQWLGRLDPATHPILVSRFLVLKAKAMRQLDASGWEPLADEAVRVLQGVDAPRDLAVALQLRGIAASILQRTGESREDLLRARQLFLAQGDELGAARVSTTMGQLAFRDNRDAEALQQLSQSAPVLEAYGAVGILFANLRGLAYLQARQGHWEDVLKTTDRLRTLLQTSGGSSSYERASYLGLRWKALGQLGRLREAEALLDEQERELRQEVHENNLGEVGTDSLVRVAVHRAYLEILQGRFDRAVETAIKGLAMEKSLPHEELSGSSRVPAGSLLFLLIEAQVRADWWSEQAPVVTLSSEHVELMRTATSIPGILARAYWNVRLHHLDEAEKDFRAALAIKASGDQTDKQVRGAVLFYVDFLLAHGRTEEAKVALDRLLAEYPELPEQDYDVAEAVLRMRVKQGDEYATRVAARQVLKLVGERRIPDDLASIVGAVRESDVRSRE